MGQAPAPPIDVVGVLKNTMRTPLRVYSFLQDQPLSSLLVFCSERTEEPIRAVKAKSLRLGVTVTHNYAGAATREFVHW